MTKFLKVILFSLTINVSYAEKSKSNPKTIEVNKEIMAEDLARQKYIEQEFNLPKADYIRYRRESSGGKVMVYALLSKEANKPIDDIISFIKKYKDNGHEDGHAEAFLLSAILYAKISHKTFDEIMNMTKDGQPNEAEMEQLGETLKINKNEYFFHLNQIRVKLKLQEKKFN